MKLRSKHLAFIAIIAALGNVLSFITINMAPIMPNFPGTNISMALDLSHLATFIASLYGGPIVGGLTGLIGGSVAAFEFGFSKGNMVAGIGLPIGKALTGVAAGILFKKLDITSKKFYGPVITVISYIPEGIFTYFLFVYLYPIFVGLPVEIATTIAISILTKAFVEMVAIGIVIIGLVSNSGFRRYLQNYFTD